MKSPAERQRSELPHIATLRIRDFKSLKELDVDFGQVNVFVGANGAGKSNLLEAIGLIGAAVSGRVDDNALLRRGVRPGVPALYKSSFQKQKHQNYIVLKATTSTGASYEANITNPISTPKPWWVFYHEQLKDGNTSIASRGPRGKAKALDLSLTLENNTSVASVARANQKTPRNVRDFLSALDDYAIFAPVTPVLRGVAPDSAPRNPVGLFGGQLPEAIGLLLNSSRMRGSLPVDEALSLIDWAAGFSVSEPSRDFMSPSVPTMRYVLRFHDRFMAKGRNILSGYDASEGALYALFMLVLAIHGQSPTVFAVDNFDQALNPRAARALTRLFVEHVLANGRQVFLTTHNPLVLDGLELDDDRIRLYAISRNTDGHTRAKRITVDIVRAKKKLGDDALSRLWIMGRLGGVPNV